jgi:two-component system, NtrC family, sensor histidine kinase AtoS
MTSPTVLILLPAILILIFAAYVFWSVTRYYRRKLGIQAEEREKTTDTTFIINAFQDVTRQLKEKEKELQRLKAFAEQRAENVESYNENILQCVTSGVMSFDVQCRLITINRAAEETLSLNHDRVMGKTCRDIFGDGEITKTVRDTLDRKIPSARMEAMLDHGGNQLWLGFNTAVLTDRQHAAIGVILSFSDLTEVKRLQEQVELRERLTALGEMSAGIAHELRNPMAVISGYLSLLAKNSDPVGQDVIRKIADEINGMNRIISDLLTFARPASLNRVSINSKELIESCVAAVIKAKDIGPGIKTSLELDDVPIVCDEVLMRQALSNLIQNAIESMQDEGTLVVESKSGKDLKISVHDTGTGIPATGLKKIFLPFYTTKDAGVGLGLALVHKIVTSHGGRIDVESKEGQGTTFTVLLPMR